MQQQEAKYMQVVSWVKENIENGTFCPGDKLMSENELSERFRLSRQTIRRATGELVKEHLVIRVQGSGTYIGDQVPESLKNDSTPEPGITNKGFTSVIPRERHMNIAVISTFNESYIFPGILRGIEKVLSQNGYSTLVSFTDNRISRERSILELILEKDNIDGIIVEPVKSALPNPNISCYQELLLRGIPVIFFNAFYKDLDVPCVRIDDTKAARIAAAILIEAGHKKIGAIFKADDGQGPLRYSGYLSALENAGLHPDQESVIWLDSPAAASLSGFEDYLFSRLAGCTGVVCYNDQIAYSLIQKAIERGIRVPEDLSVVGIDDSYLAGVCKVPFTSIVHPKELLGSRVAENLVQMIQDPSYDGSCLMDVETVERDSVAIRRE